MDAHANAYAWSFPTPPLADLGLLANIARCSGCGGWTYKACRTCKEARHG
jgi:hypothetical protein